MKLFKLWYAIVMLLALIPLLTACPGGFERVRSVKPETPQQVAQQAVNEAQAAIAAGYTTITNARTEKWITQDEFTTLRDSIDKADDAYRKAFDLYTLQDFIKAKDKAELAIALVNLVTRQLAAARAK